MRVARWIAAGLALLAVAAGLWKLSEARAGLTITREVVGTTPVTVFRGAGGARLPAVVIAHGFAGSQQLMQPFAETLARSGMLAVTFDFPGHGRNPAPMPGGLVDEGARNQALQAALGAVIDFARALPQADGRVALLGHSMATDIVLRQAIARKETVATVAVSMFSPAVTAAAPRNLLVIVGALEPEMLQAEARRVVAMVAGGPPAERTTYGSLAEGTARRLSLSGGVEHVGVLYSAQTLVEARDWLAAAFGLPTGGPVDRRPPWLGVLFAGLVLLAWPLSALLPEVCPAPAGAGLGWRHLALPAVAPALLTPAIVTQLPTQFLPLLLGDYLTLHCAVYGGLTWLCLQFVARRRARQPVSVPRLAVSAGLVGAYALLALGLPLNAYVASFLPAPGQAWLAGAVFLGTLPWFLADEWLTHGAGGPGGAAWGGGVATKLLFAASLALAVAMDPGRLFFLVIIIPVILVFLLVYALFGRWTYAATRHPFPAAIGNAAALAWAIAVTFPRVG